VEVQYKDGYPRGIVRDRVNGQLYRIVGIHKNKYLLISEKEGADGRKDKKMVHKDDPKDRYEPVGFYE